MHLSTTVTGCHFTLILLLIQAQPLILTLIPTLDPVHTIPVRNETVTKLLRLGLAFTRYQYEKA